MLSAGVEELPDGRGSAFDAALDQLSKSLAKRPKKNPSNGHPKSLRTADSPGLLVIYAFLINLRRHNMWLLILAATLIVLAWLAEPKTCCRAAKVNKPSGSYHEAGTTSGGISPCWTGDGTFDGGDEMGCGAL
jgi:hypothetical protein